MWDPPTCSWVHISCRRVVVYSRGYSALKHCVSRGPLRLYLTILHLYVVSVWIWRDSFVVRAGCSTDFRSVSRLSIHWLRVEEENTVVRVTLFVRLTCAATYFIDFLLLDVSNVGHIAGVLLNSSLRQKTFRRILPNDNVLLNSAVTRLLFLNLPRLLLIHWSVELHICLDDLARRLGVGSLAVVAGGATRAWFTTTPNRNVKTHESGILSKLTSLSCFLMLHRSFTFARFQFF